MINQIEQQRRGHPHKRLTELFYIKIRNDHLYADVDYRNELHV